MRPSKISLNDRVRRRGNASPDSAQRKSSPVSGDIVSSTFANINLRFARAAMAEYSRRCDSMSRNNELLRTQLEERQSDAIKVVQHLELKLREAEAAVAVQRGEIERLVGESAAAEEALRCQYEHMLEERDRQIAQYASITQALQTELKASSREVQDRAMHRLELQQLHDEIEEIRMRHECELAALRFQSVDRKMRLVSLEETMRERFQLQVEKELARLLEVKSKALIEDNEALQHERIRLTQDIEELVQLATAKDSECADERRKGELHRRACDEALRRIVNGNRRAQEFKVRTQRLEQRVKELTHEKQVLREELSRQYEARIQELERKLAETEKSLYTHREELQRLRHVASAVVGQRSDLERFFYVALNDVRRMRSGTSHCQKPPKRRIQTFSTQLPSITNSDVVNLSSTGTSSVVFTQQQQQQQQQQQWPPLGQSSGNLSSSMPGSSPFLTESIQNTNNGVSSGFPSPPRAVVLPGSAAVLAPSPPPFEQPWRRGDGGVRATHSVSASGGNALQVNLGKDGEGAYIDDLSWNDKEKIIKALLFFINQTTYQRLPGKLKTDNNEKLQKI